MISVTSGRPKACFTSSSTPSGVRGSGISTVFALFSMGGDHGVNLFTPPFKGVPVGQDRGVDKCTGPLGARPDPGIEFGCQPDGRRFGKAPSHPPRIQRIQKKSTFFYSLYAGQVTRKAPKARKQGTKSLADKLMQGVEVSL